MRIKILALFAKAMGIQFKINGEPYGSKITRNYARHLANQRNQNSEMPSRT